MIELTKFDGTKFVINAHLIEFIYETPDTVIKTVSGTTIVVKESKEEVINKIIEYRRKLGFLAGNEP